MTEDTYNLGVSALDAMDQYLDGQVSYDATLTRLTTITEGLGDISDGPGDLEQRLAASNLAAFVVDAGTSLMMYDLENVDLATVVDARNTLAEQINKSKR
jgi:hypothetical protein